MRKVFSLLIIVGMTLPATTGCIIRTRGRHQHASGGHSRSCPPAYHWDGRGCVHNGRGHARGHRK